MTAEFRSTDAASPRRSSHQWKSWSYDRWGTTGRPVLLLHGVPFDRTMWLPVGAELATECTVIAPDLPAHGDAERLALELATLIDGLGLRRAPVVAGYGTSAALATTFAASVATQALVTVDAAPDAEPGEGRTPFSGAAARVPEGTVHHAVTARATADPVRFAAILRAML